LYVLLKNNMDNTFDEIYQITNCINLEMFLNNVPRHIKLLCIHINIRSIIKNFHSLEQCIDSSSRSVDVIMLTEVNISYPLDNMYNLKGYNMYSELRRGRRGGGIIIYTKKYHRFNIINNKMQHCENLIGVLTTPSDHSSVLCCLYRPPNFSKHLFVKELDTLLKTLGKHQDIYLLGDINIDLQSDRPIKHIYNTAMYNYGLACGINQYTRIEISNGRLSKSCIDHIYARSHSLDLYTAALGTALADHRVIALAAVDSSAQDTRGESRCVTRYDYDLLRKNLLQIDWRTAELTFCPDKIYSIIVDNIKKCREKCEIKIKISNNKNRINNKWITKKIIKSCKYRDKLFMKWSADPTNYLMKKKYNKCRNCVNKLINKAKCKTIREEINSNKNNPRALWQILNEITGRAKALADTIILNAFLNNSRTVKEIADNFAKSFSNSVDNIVPKCDINLIEKDAYAFPANVTCRYQTTTPKSVLKVIKSLNNTKAPGIDGIRVCDLKLIGEKVAEIIAHFINASIRTGKYPHVLKTGIVRPIHKKGKQDAYDNYRPITILSIIDKITENREPNTHFL
jgi:hypothetical protein